MTTTEIVRRHCIIWNGVFRIVVAFITALAIGLGFVLSAANAQITDIDGAAPVDRMASSDEDAIAAGDSVTLPGTEFSIDKRELEKFVDGMFNTVMADRKIAGSVVAIVTKDEQLLLKGYGFADAENGIRTDPDKHLFRVASISKLFTATSIMQLVEQGLIDLDADIRTYLGDLQFDDSISPIKVKNLLTHTPGFEDPVLGYYGENAKLANQPRAEQFAALAPRQVIPAGELIAYSNFGFTLLGEIIAQTSGKPYAEYIYEKIFSPLGMENSTSSIRSTPVGAGTEKIERLRTIEAKSHRFSKGRFVVQSFPEALDLLEPEGSIASTATDMSRFMQAYLNNGKGEGERILAEETVIKMQQPLFTHMPGIGGNAHGFWLGDVMGHKVIRHGGSIHDFKSTLVLFPDLGLGIFVSSNTAPGGALNRLPMRIAEAFFPSGQNYRRYEGGVPETDLSTVSGRYFSARRNHTKVEKIFSMEGIFSIEEDDGAIVVSDSGGSNRYERADDGLFRRLDTYEPLRFDVGVDGESVVAFFGSSSSAYEKLTFRNEPNTLFIPIGLAVASSLLVIAGYAVRLFGFSLTSAASAPAFDRGVVLVTAGIVLTAFAALLRAVATITSDTSFFYAEFPTPGFLTLISLAALVVFAAAGNAILATRRVLSTSSTLLSKVRLSMFAIVLLLVSWALFHWNVFSY